MPRHPDTPRGYDRVREKITGAVPDSIVIYPWSHGILYLEGQYGIDRPPPRCEVRISATNADRCEIEDYLPDSPGADQCAYRVWNYNDSPAFADLVLLDQPED